MQILDKIISRTGDDSIHDLIYFIGLCILVSALPTSIYVVSASQLMLGANWLLEGAYIEKIRRFFSNRAAVTLSAVYLIYLVGLLWTEDLAYGIGYDILNKIPILTLPLTLASIKPVRAGRMKYLPLLFSLSVLVASLVGFVIFLSHDFIDPRAISPFESHIFFSMMAAFAVFLLPWSIKQFSKNRLVVAGSYAVSAWLVVYLFILSSMTGLLSLSAVVVYLLFAELFTGKNRTKRIFAALILVMAFVFAAGVVQLTLRPLLAKIDPDPTSLLEMTPDGSIYHHDIGGSYRENGHLVYYFVADEELGEAWNRRSGLLYGGEDLRGNELRATLCRYMSSKGLRKDAYSLSLLEDDEIRAVENGIPNYLYLSWPNFLIRIHQTFWELQELERTGDPYRHSLTTRLELWKASWTAFTMRPLAGWGTGDVIPAVRQGLAANQSMLEPTGMKTHPHNQYFHLLLMVGVLGALLFSGLIYLYLKRTGAMKHHMFRIFVVIALSAMLVDSPIDSQIGLSFLLFFFLYFGILYRPGNDEFYRA